MTMAVLLRSGVKGNFHAPFCRRVGEVTLRLSSTVSPLVASQHFREFWSAYRTIAGYEAMNMIRKGQIENVERGNIIEQVNYINSLFGIAVSI